MNVLTQRGCLKRDQPALTSLHQHGDLFAFGTLAEQVDHLVVRHALHVSLVHLHDDVPLLEATAARVVHDLLHPLPSASGTVGDGKAEALVSFLHVYGDEFRLRGDGWGQGDHVAGVVVLGRGIGGHLSWGAVGSRETIEGCAAVVQDVVVVLTAVAGWGVVAFGALLAVDDDGIFVFKNSHWGNQAGVGVIRIKGEWVATAQLQVDHGANGDGLEDLYNLGMGVAKYTCFVDVHDYITLEEGGQVK